jgi:hypothetical protein
MEQVLVKTFENLPGVELAKNLLAAERVWPMVRGCSLSGCQGGGGSTLLIVKKEELGRARLILGIEF